MVCQVRPVRRSPNAPASTPQCASSASAAPTGGAPATSARSSPFAHADILILLGETLCIELPATLWRTINAPAAATTAQHQAPAAAPTRPALVTPPPPPPVEAAHGACEFDEEPERWDGLS